MSKKTIICFPHQPSLVGGPGTFQKNIESFLVKNEFKVIYPNSDLKPDLIMVVAGTRKIFWLLLMKLKGVKILHRLDGMNWKYKFEEGTILSKYKQIFQNFLIYLIRNYLADHVIYQSHFVESWWIKKYGKKSNSSIIVNGSSFYEESKEQPYLREEIVLTCVEGTIQSDNVTTAILHKLDENFKSMMGIGSIEIFGNYSQYKNLSTFKNINFVGSVKRDDMRDILKSKKRIFLLLELNPPCPNSMIEALCLGIPCIGFDSGSFVELMDGAGIALPYNEDVWKLEVPNMNGLIEAINNVNTNYEALSRKAQEVSKKYDLNIMCNKYLKIIHKLIE